MSILMFDHTTRIYLPAEELLRDRGVREISATHVSRRAAERGEGSTAGDQQRALHHRLERAYHPDEAEGTLRERQPALLAHQIMSSPVVTLHAQATLAEARTMFRRHRFRHIPIRSSAGQLCGILSDRDLLRHDADWDDTPIRPLITERVFAASADTEIRDIARTLFEHHFGAMPIIEPDGRPSGIITRSDILRTLINRAPLELWV